MFKQKALIQKRLAVALLALIALTAIVVRCSKRDHDIDDSAREQHQESPHDFICCAAITRDGNSLVYVCNNGDIGSFKIGEMAVSWLGRVDYPESLTLIPDSTQFSLVFRDPPGLSVLYIDPDKKKLSKGFKVPGTQDIELLSSDRLISWEYGDKDRRKHPVLQAINMQTHTPIYDFSSLQSNSTITAIRPFENGKILIFSYPYFPMIHRPHAERTTNNNTMLPPSMQKKAINKKDEASSQPTLELMVFQLSNHKVISRAETVGNRAHITHGGRFVAISSLESIKVWRLPSLTPVKEIQLKNSYGKGPVLSSNARLIAFTSIQGNNKPEVLKLIDTNYPERRCDLESIGNEPTSLSNKQEWWYRKNSRFSLFEFLIDGYRLITLTSDGEVTIWDCLRRQKLRRFILPHER